MRVILSSPQKNDAKRKPGWGWRAGFGNCGWGPPVGVGHGICRERPSIRPGSDRPDTPYCVRREASWKRLDERSHLTRGFKPQTRPPARATHPSLMIKLSARHRPGECRFPGSDTGLSVICGPGPQCRSSGAVWNRSRTTAATNN
jgi:hypothetical protein